MRSRQVLLILIITTFLALGGKVPPTRAGFHPQLDFINTLAWPLAFSALSVSAYYIYKNSPAAREEGYRQSLGMGEWYFGGYLGLSYIPPRDWNTLHPNEWSVLGQPGPLSGQHFSFKHNVYQLGPQVGLKFGRFFDRHPWFGLEVEWSFARNNLHQRSLTVTPAMGNGQNTVTLDTDWAMSWAMQTNMLARYGFLKDKEVPFGRLQPYVGLGPGFEIVYGKTDSFKNFAIETLAGIRYMCTKNLGLFVEYKFSYQFKVEYEEVRPAGGNLGQGMVTFDLPHHRFVVGVAYHFKNLYGN